MTFLFSRGPSSIHSRILGSIGITEKVDAGYTVLTYSCGVWISRCDLVNFRFADHPHKAAAHAIPLSRRSDANLNLRLSRWTDAVRLFVAVYCVSRFVNIILRNGAALFVTTPCQILLQMPD